MRSVRLAMMGALFAGCAAGGDSGPDVVGTQDAPPVDMGQTLDVGPADTGPTDTGVPVDTGHDTGISTRPDTGAMCPSVCTTNAECQTACPAAPTGYYNCCQTGSGGGSCSQFTSPCSATTSGTIGSPCTMDSQCNAGGATCCIMTGSSGACGCMSSFIPGTCVAPPLCS